MKRKKTTKRTVNPPKVIKEELVFTLPFHETFPFTLKHLKSPEKRVCYFQCKEHMNKYIERSKMSKKEYKIEETQPKDEEET